jgi:putative ABC transport system permease protein
MSLRFKIKALFRRMKLDADMAEEMRAHVERRTEANLTAGMSPADARYEAAKAFGHLDSLKEAARDARGWRWLDNFLQDARYGFRSMGKRPGFTAAVVLTLALGIGFVTTLFTMINGIVFAQLPFEAPQQIVNIGVSAPQFDVFAREQQSCTEFAFFQQFTANLRAGNFASRESAVRVSANFLDVLRVRPARGRGFSASEAAPAAERSVLIGDTVWEREFQRDPAAVGRIIQINGEAHTIVGVMAPGFGFPFNQRLWVLRRASEAINGGMVFGRLRPDVTVQEASDQFTAIAAGLAVGRAVDGTPARRITVERFTDSMVKDALRIILIAILAATFLVLILACANVANLILARAVDRRKELAVRAALGAGRMRLISQMLTENFVLVTLGAVGGLGLAAVGTRALWSYMMREEQLTGGVPFWISFNVDARVFLFVVAAALFASLLTGLLPALQISRVDLNDALKQGAGGGLRLSRLTRMLVNAQMAFSVCLVTVAGLFLAIMTSFNRKALPYDPTTVLTAEVALEGRAYEDPTARVRFFGQLVERLAATPGVTAAGLDSAQSLRLARNPRVELEGEVYAREQDRPGCGLETVSENFLEVFQGGLLGGRTFTAADHATSLPVAVVNAGFAGRFGGGREILGRRFRIAGDSNNPWITIVGVVPDLGSMKAGEAARGPMIYRPLAQDPVRTMTVLVRGSGDAMRFANAIRREVAALDPELPVGRVQTVQEIIELERIGMNAFGSLFVVCGLGALTLASVGVYGVLAFSVRMRTRDFGVRLALGADRGIIMRLVMGQGARQMSVGLGIGVLLALGASAALSSMIAGFGHSAYDVRIYAGVVALLAIVAGAALFIPARRASRVDPMVALRAE